MALKSSCLHLETSGQHLKNGTERLIINEMTNVWQNILACDALCNPFRAPNNPCLSIFLILNVMFDSFTPSHNICT